MCGSQYDCACNISTIFWEVIWGKPGAEELVGQHHGQRRDFVKMRCAASGFTLHNQGELPHSSTFMKMVNSENRRRGAELQESLLFTEFRCRGIFATCLSKEVENFPLNISFRLKWAGVNSHKSYSLCLVTIPQDWASSSHTHEHTGLPYSECAQTFLICLAFMRCSAARQSPN